MLLVSQSEHWLGCVTVLLPKVDNNLRVMTSREALTCTQQVLLPSVLTPVVVVHQRALGPQAVVDRHQPAGKHTGALNRASHCLAFAVRHC